MKMVYKNINCYIIIILCIFASSGFSASMKLNETLKNKNMEVILSDEEINIDATTGHNLTHEGLLVISDMKTLQTLLQTFHYPGIELPPFEVETQKMSMQEIANELECELELYHLSQENNKRFELKSNSYIPHIVKDSSGKDIKYQKIKVLLAKPSDYGGKYHFYLLKDLPEGKGVIKEVGHRLISMALGIAENPLKKYLTDDLHIPLEWVDVILDAKLDQAILDGNLENITKKIQEIIETIIRDDKISWKNIPGIQEYMEEKLKYNPEMNFQTKYSLTHAYVERWKKVANTTFSSTTINRLYPIIERMIKKYHISKYEWAVVGHEIQKIIDQIGGFFPKMIQAIAQNEMIISNEIIRKYLVKFLDENISKITNDELIKKFHKNFQENKYKSCELCDEKNAPCIQKAGSVASVNEIICYWNDGISRFIVKTLHKGDIKEKYSQDYYITNGVLKLIQNATWFHELRQEWNVLDDLEMIKVIPESIFIAYREVQDEFDFEIEKNNTELGSRIISEANEFFGTLDEDFLVKGAVPTKLCLGQYKTMLLQSKENGQSLTSFLSNADIIHRKNIPIIVSQLLSYFGYMLFKQHIFHGDLHGGNILISWNEDEEKNMHYTLTFIDWGTMIKIEENHQQDFKVLMNLLSMNAVFMDKVQSGEMLDTISTNLNVVQNFGVTISEQEVETFLNAIAKTINDKQIIVLGEVLQKLGYEVKLNSQNLNEQNKLMSPDEKSILTNKLIGFHALSLNLDLFGMINMQSMKKFNCQSLRKIEKVQPSTLFVTLQKNLLHMMGILHGNGLHNQVRVYAAWKYFHREEAEATSVQLKKFISLEVDWKELVETHYKFDPSNPNNQKNQAILQKMIKNVLANLF